MRISADRGPRLRLHEREHADRPWHIHELTPDFRVEDVWELPDVIGADDFPLLVERIAALDLANSSSAIVRALVAIRSKLGAVLRWDRPDAGVGTRVTSLRERLPADLRDGPRGPAPSALPFTPLYLTDDEWAAEAANDTVHGVLHVGRVPTGEGGHRARLAILVKPNGLLGRAYLTAIRPFRHLVVYPSVLREVTRDRRSQSVFAKYTSVHDHSGRVSSPRQR